MIEGNRALEMLAENRTNEVVITTMSTARTWPAISSRPDLDYPLRGCMGKASSLGLGIALLFASGLRGMPFLLAAVLAPYAVSEVSAVVMWRYLFDLDVGYVAIALSALGLPPLEWAINPVHGLILVALLSIWLHLPFTFVILYSARLAIPKDLYVAAEVD